MVRGCFIPVLAVCVLLLASCRIPTRDGIVYGVSGGLPDAVGLPITAKLVGGGHVIDFTAPTTGSVLLYHPESIDSLSMSPLLQPVREKKMNAWCSTKVF